MATPCPCLAARRSHTPAHGLGTVLGAPAHIHFKKSGLLPREARGELLMLAFLSFRSQLPVRTKCGPVVLDAPRIQKPSMPPTSLPVLPNILPALVRVKGAPQGLKQDLGSLTASRLLIMEETATQQSVLNSPNSRNIRAHPSSPSPHKRKTVPVEG